jgi:hypothetical protein
MQFDRFTKTCLLAITLLLIFLALQPAIERRANAASAVQYDVACLPNVPSDQDIKQLLDQRVRKGWEFAFAWSTTGNGGSPSNCLIFRLP